MLNKVELETVYSIVNIIKRFKCEKLVKIFIREFFNNMKTMSIWQDIKDPDLLLEEVRKYDKRI